MAEGSARAASCRAGIQGDLIAEHRVVGGVDHQPARSAAETEDPPSSAYLGRARHVPVLPPPHASVQHAVEERPDVELEHPVVVPAAFPRDLYRGTIVKALDEES
jgi:hypothetical protein